MHTQHHRKFYIHMQILSIIAAGQLVCCIKYAYHEFHFSHSVIMASSVIPCILIFSVSASDFPSKRETLFLEQT